MHVKHTFKSFLYVRLGEVGIIITSVFLGVRFIFILRFCAFSIVNNLPGSDKYSTYIYIYTNAVSKIYLFNIHQHEGKYHKVTGNHIGLALEPYLIPNRV